MYFLRKDPTALFQIHSVSEYFISDNINIVMIIAKKACIYKSTEHIIF